MTTERMYCRSVSALRNGRTSGHCFGMAFAVREPNSTSNALFPQGAVFSFVSPGCALSCKVCDPIFLCRPGVMGFFLDRGRRFFYPAY